MNRSIKGFSLGVISSASFGLIPLFIIPLMREGMRTDTILLYRFIITALVVALLMVSRGENFSIKRSQLPTLLLLALLYTGSALFLFLGYNYMSSGVATTIHFTYPVFTALIMITMFKERSSRMTLLSIAMAVGGVALLSLGGDSSASPIGVVIVVLSAICYALYIVGINRFKLEGIEGMKLTFYVFSICTIIFLIFSLVQGGVEVIPSKGALCNLALLATITTVISNLTMVAAVKRIGSTLTSVLGAMEPLTAVVVGILIFKEENTTAMVMGIITIISAVTMIIVSATRRAK